MRKGLAFPVATFAITAVTVAAYFLLSNGQPYVFPITKMDPFGLSGDNLLGAFTYEFMHIGLKHLLGNILVLLAIGAVLEQRLESRHVAGLYIAAGAGAGLVYALLFPNVWVIGASAAIAGAIVTSLLVDIRRATVALVAAVIIIPYGVFPFTDWALNTFSETAANKTAELGAQKAELGKALKQLEQQAAAGNASAAEAAVHVSQEIQVIEQQQRNIVQNVVTVSKARQTESVTPVSFEIHFFGAMFALAYLAAFRRDAFQFIKRDALALYKWARRL
jgi:membrane associated rhomboid family serine protease